MFVVGAVLPEQKSFTKILSSLCKEVLVKKVHHRRISWCRTAPAARFWRPKRGAFA